MRKVQRASTALRKRIRALIDARFGGSVNAAAHAWGIPQPSLQRIADGTTKNPRRSTLARIAELEMTTVEWLLTGNGPDPFQRETMRYDSKEAEEWDSTITSLRLGSADYEAAIFLPWAIHDAGEALLHSIGSKNQTPEDRRKVGRAWRTAERLASKSWNTLLSGLIEVYGADAVRQAWEEHRLRSRLGFTTHGDRLLENPEVRAALEDMVRADEKEKEEQAELFRSAVNATDPLERRRQLLVAVKEWLSRSVVEADEK